MRKFVLSDGQTTTDFVFFWAHKDHTIDQSASPEFGSSDTNFRHKFLFVACSRICEGYHEMDLDDEGGSVLEPVGSFPVASDVVMKERRVVKARRGTGGFPPLVQSIDDEPFSVEGTEEELGFEGDLDELQGMDENIRANDANLDVVDLGGDISVRNC
jgi:hypothetical protein